MSNQQQPQTPKKAVTFATTASMRLGRHLNDYTEEEINATYYSGSDFREFKRDIKGTLRMMNLKQKMDDVNYCSRGIECLMKQSLAIRSRRRDASLMAVLNKELHQFLRTTNEDCHDDERIAVVYSGVSRESATEAHEAGLADQHYVKIQSSLQYFKQTQKRLAADERLTNNVSLHQLINVKNGSVKRTTKRTMYNSAA